MDSLIDYEKITTYSYDAMKLERVRRLLDALGNPQNAFRSVHVAGTRGKGSTCAMLYAIFREAGIPTGLYTSPHLLSRHERIRTSIKGEEQRCITDGELAFLLEEIKPALDALTEETGPFTFFEVFTALSFLYFKQRKVEMAVLEVGMGGRLDATNVVHPLVSVITPISYDHTDKLGKTLTSIAAEKAEIVKPETAAVTAPQEPEALEVIREIARTKSAPLLEVAEHYNIQELGRSREGTRFQVMGPGGDYPLLFVPLLGAHQVDNAVTAIGVCEVLKRKGFSLSKASIQKGLSKVDWPGRIQVVGEEPLLILDGAQNDASANALKETLCDLFPGKPVLLILGISQDKEVETVCRILCPMAESVILTQAKNKRALPVCALMDYAAPYSRYLQLVPSLDEALDWACRRVDGEWVVVVAGSLYLVGEALAFLQEAKSPKKKAEKVAS